MKKLLKIIKWLAIIIATIGLLGVCGVAAYTKVIEYKYQYTADHWYTPEYGTLVSDGELFLVRYTDTYLAQVIEKDNKLYTTVGWFIDECVAGSSFETDTNYSTGETIVLKCKRSDRTGRYYIMYVESRPTGQGTSNKVNGYSYKVSPYRIADYIEENNRFKAAKALNQ